MEYLKIRRSKAQRRANGLPYAVPLWVTKQRKYGTTISEKAISIKQPILVTGAHDSGKTRWLQRMHEHAEEIWGRKITAKPLYIEALNPMSSWCEPSFLGAWWDQRRLVLTQLNPEWTTQPWKNLKTHTRLELLSTYCQDTEAVVLIDDAHKLTGRKLQIVRQCVLEASIFVMAASEEQRLPPSLRSVVMRREPQIFRLDSEVSYDATNLFMWAVLLACLAVGWWEAALVLGGVKALGTGRRATRAD